jgi:hypothetical protein
MFEGTQEVSLTIERTAVYGYELITRRFGQAVPLDLGSNGLVFALLRYPYGVEGQRIILPAAACGLPELPAERTEDTLADWVKQARAFEGECVVPRSSWPIFVRFGDTTRPDTLERVWPDSLVGSAGKAQVTRVTLRRSSAPLEQSLQRYLPWLSAAADFAVPVDGGNATGPITIRLADFVNLEPK